MCLLLSNEAADECIKRLQRTGDKKQANMLKRLVRLASDDDEQEANGLHKTLEVVTSWIHHDILRNVRKWRSGHHRFFITGRHTDCRYTLCYVKVNKREEEDREEEPEFMRRIERALTTETTRQLTGEKAHGRNL